MKFVTPVMPLMRICQVQCNKMLKTFFQIKGSFSARSGQANFNPYGYGNFCLNCLAVLCGPVQPSLIGKMLDIIC